MSKLIEFLETIKNSEYDYSYALTDGWEVVIWKGREDNADDEILFTTDIHSVLRDIMSYHDIEDYTP
jgi:hypothetical protein